MGQRESYAQGTFCWTDLATSDVAAARRFYGPLLGWEFEDVPGPEGRSYVEVRKDGLLVTGMVEVSNLPSAWISYVSVADADTTIAKLRELGGSTPVTPFEVPGARLAIVTDQAGGHFGLWETGARAGAELVNDPGAMSLNQLNTTDVEGSQRFYAELLGWSFQLEAAEPSSYWGIYIGEALNGGMMADPGGAPVPAYWLTYFTTRDIDAAVAAIAGSGGQVITQPMQIPSGRIAVAGDPQGAFFALFEGEVDD